MKFVKDFAPNVNPVSSQVFYTFVKFVCMCQTGLWLKVVDTCLLEWKKKLWYVWTWKISPNQDGGHRHAGQIANVLHEILIRHNIAKRVVDIVLSVSLRQKDVGEWCKYVLVRMAGCGYLEWRTNSEFLQWWSPCRKLWTVI